MQCALIFFLEKHQDVQKKVFTRTNKVITNSNFSISEKEKISKNKKVLAKIN